MADLKSLCKEFKPDTNLSFDIRYADDTTIISTVFEKLQLSTEELQAACRKWGMKIDFSKCKVITSTEKCIILEREEHETVGEFCFLGSIVTSTEREERYDVSRRIALAAAVFGRLRNCILSNRSIYDVEAWML